MEVEALPREHRGRLRDLGRVGVRRGAGSPRRALRRGASGERGLHAEAALAAAALGGGVRGGLRVVDWGGVRGRGRGGEAEEAGLGPEAEGKGEKAREERLGERHGGDGAVRRRV